MKNMGLGVFIVIPLAFFMLLYYAVLSISTYRTANYHTDNPNEVKASTVFLLSVLSLLPSVALCLCIINIF